MFVRKNHSMLKKLVVLTGLLVATTFANAEWGIGDKLCSDYLRAQRGSPEQSDQFNEWMFGYMTALSDYIRIDPKEKYPYQPILNRVQYHCNDSGMRFANAVRRAVHDVYRPAQAPRFKFER